MPSRAVDPQLTILSKIQSIDIAWQITDGDDNDAYRYVAKKASINWDSENQLLRFYAECSEGDDADYWMQVSFGKKGAVLKWDAGEEPEVRALNRFDGPAGIILEHRSRTECISIFIK